MHGTKASNISATKCDVLIVLGARFSDRVITNSDNIKNAKIIHIDIDPAEINKNIKVDLSIIGDLKIIINKILLGLNNNKNDEWINYVIYLKSLGEIKSKESELLTPEFFFDTLNELDEDNLIIATEVGQHQMWTSQYYNFRRPRTFISSGGLGTMGFGLGASIGAQFAKPECKVINIAGDGSFMMNCQEIATAVKNKLPLVVVIMDNNVLGMVRQWQTLFFDGRYSESTLDRSTDLVKLAEAFGAKGYRVSNKYELEPILKEALSSKEPVVIDYLIESDEKVFPMVAPGAPINQIITEEDLA